MSTLDLLAAATTMPGNTSTSKLGMPAPELRQLLVALAFMLAISLAATTAAWFLGAFRSGVQGPARVLPNQPVWPTTAALLAGVIAFLFVGAIYVVATGLPASQASAVVDEAAQPPAAQVADADEPTPAVMVQAMQLSVYAYTAAAAVAIALLLMLRNTVGAGVLGLSTRHIPAGLLVGGIALVLVMPWMMTAVLLLQLVRAALGYPPEAMHQILETIRDDPQWRTIVWALLAALVVAPIAEEILFRGFLQTSLVHGLPRLFGAARHEAPVPAGFEVVGRFDAPFSPVGATGAPFDAEASAGNPAFASAAPLTSSSGHVAPSAAWRWSGIAVTALLFASLHEAWSIPLIFLLALFLGYVYERTGSLWTAIVLHFGFNALNTAVVLWMLWAS